MKLALSRRRLWSIPYTVLQQGYSSARDGLDAGLLVIIGQLVTKGFVQASQVLISPWLMVQIHSSPPE
jgi:hypothetical protein